MFRAVVFLLITWSWFCCVVVWAQEEPTFPIQPFSGAIYRTNLCESQNRLATGKVELKNALAGLNLTVGVVDHNLDALLKFDSRGRLDATEPGLFAVLLDELASRAGFQWRHSYGLILPPYHDIIQQHNRDNNRQGSNAITWTDILVDAVERYDFTFAEWVHNLYRRQLGIGFPTGWFDASTILIQHSQYKSPAFSVTSFLRPFSNKVWLMIFAVIVFSGIMHFIFERLFSTPTRRGEKRKFRGADLFFPAMAFTQHHLDWEPNTHSQRLFAFSISFWSLIIASAYTANLASFLVAQDIPSFIDITLQQAHQQKVPVCVRGGAAVANQLQRKYPNMVIRQGDSFVDTYQRLRAGDCVVMASRASDWSTFQRNAEVNPDCLLQWIGRAEVINSGGAAVKVDVGEFCTSLVMHVLDIHFNEMIADGFVDKAWQNYVEGQSTNECGTTQEDAGGGGDSESERSLRPVDVGGIFVVHVVLTTIALGMAIVESRRRRRLAEEERRRKGPPVDEYEIEKLEYQEALQQVTAASKQQQQQRRRLLQDTLQRPTTRDVTVRRKSTSTMTTMTTSREEDSGGDDELSINHDQHQLIEDAFEALKQYLDKQQRSC